MHDGQADGRGDRGAERAGPSLAISALVAAWFVVSPGGWAGIGVLHAQSTGSVRGSIASLADGSPVAQAVIEVEDTGHRTLSADDGTFELTAVPAGERVLIVSAYFNGGQRVDVSVPAGGAVDVTIEFRPVPFALDEIRVVSASRVAQRVVESPVAIDVADKVDQRNYASTGQHAQVLKGLTGMDVVANGIHDFNVNTRGFNADLSQRLLVLMDGRDLAIPFLGAQEWSALSVPLDDLERIEVVRGPGSALYGANAYNGVVNLVTPAPRAVVGTKLSISGGELGTVRGDARVARVFGPDARLGIRANVGYYRSEDWHRSRTNVGDLEREYAAAIDPSEFPVETPAPGFEVTPLNGQTVAAIPAAATGEPDPVRNVYGSARLDYYHDESTVGTLEAGVARAENQVFMTNVGRFQVDHAWRPWARAAWAHERYYAMAWYSGRSSHQQSLASGAPIDERSSLLHTEAQWNATGFDETGRLIVGGSYRRSLVDSEGTLVAPADDDRDDWAGAVFGQAELEVTPGLRLVAAGRYDDSNLYDHQLSPKGAVVVEPAPGHSFRASVGRAYQTPRMTNFFLRVPLGVPSDLTALEDQLRAQFGAALDGVPEGELFTSSASVPALALGNRDLGVERVVSWEAGYRGEFRRRVQVTVDGYYSEVEDFVSALLPNANPTYGPWTSPEAVDPSVRGDLEAAVLTAVGPGAGLTRLDDEERTTATVFSYGNAGRATEWGVEVGVSVEVTPTFHLDGSYAWFDYRVDEGVPLVPGDLIVPNTPEHKGSFQARYTSLDLDAWAGLTFKTAYEWSSGFFRGRIPASERVDAGVGYVIGERMRIHAAATNLFDVATYHIYGGSIDRRRILLGLTAYW